MSDEQHSASLSPRYKPGDRVMTNWGEEIVIEGISVYTSITYEANGTIWSDSELRPVPDNSGKTIVKSRKCLIHGEVEHEYTDSFRWCPECWHVFQTTDDIRLLLWDEIGIIPEDEGWRVEDMKSCPLCHHDW
jgi:hypothetical protein